MCMENMDDETYTKTCAVSKWFRLNPVKHEVSFFGLPADIIY